MTNRSDPIGQHGLFTAAHSFLPRSPCPTLTAARSRPALDGRPYTLCLTLGALAELEHAFGHEDMLALAERFQSGRLSARDAQRIIAAGLRGAGHDIADDAVARMQADGAAAGFVDIVARLLSATFRGQTLRVCPPADNRHPGRSDASRRRASLRSGTSGRRARHPPFPWHDVMAAGLGLLRLRPADFWSMTPRELDAALHGLLGPPHGNSPLPRPALAELMARYPDKRE